MRGYAEKSHHRYMRGSLQSRLCDILAYVTYSHVFALSEDESLCQQAILGFLPFGQSP